MVAESIQEAASAQPFLPLLLKPTEVLRALGEALLTRHADEVNLESATKVQKMKDEPLGLE